MATGRCKEQLAQYELTIYQMAMLLHSCEKVATAITKTVLCEIWKDKQFFELHPKKQTNRIMWLVSQYNQSAVVSHS